MSAGPEAEAFIKTGSSPPNIATHTLDLAGAAYATAHVALALDKTALATKLLALSNYSLNAYDTTTCLLKNRTEEYYEGTYMNYGFRPLTDMKSRIALCNSTDHFVELMDAFFGYGREPAVQLPIAFITAEASEMSPGNPAWVGDLWNAGSRTHTFEGLCNEPDMETPYSYAYAGRADRVQEVVTAVKTYSYAPGRGGLAGNDDSGGEAAWYVWAAVGIFPVAGQPIYIVGSPSFHNITVAFGKARLRILCAARAVQV